MLYNNYLREMDWWANNVGTLPNNELGVKKLYTSFTIRDSLNNNKMAKKAIYSSAREIIRIHVLEKGWQKDNEFGSLTFWFENMIKQDNLPLKVLSHFCICKKTSLFNKYKLQKLSLFETESLSIYTIT